MLRENQKEKKISEDGNTIRVYAQIVFFWSSSPAIS